MVEKAGGFIDGIFFCPHLPTDGCGCRKPATGLFEQIENEFACSLRGCFLVGDGYKDIQAALAFGLRPILVRTGKGSATERRLLSGNNRGVPVVDSLAMAVKDVILQADE